eukprot:m.24476 g.24476  ORF g.24476 m.24476 type:complete len:70 (-) comp8594_c0_seq4:862-1071(-)
MCLSITLHLSYQANYGAVDVLVSNAAVNPTFGPTLETTEEAWDKVFEINVKSSFLLAKEFVPTLTLSKG